MSISKNSKKVSKSISAWASANGRKGIASTQAAGKAYRWGSEEARAASQARWGQARKVSNDGKFEARLRLERAVARRVKGRL